jgi:hypothetical protein
MSISAKRAFLFELRRSARCSIGRWCCPAAPGASNVLRHESAPQFGLTQLMHLSRKGKPRKLQPNGRLAAPLHQIADS